MFVNVPWTDSSLGTGHTHATKIEVFDGEDPSARQLEFGGKYTLTAGGETCNFTIEAYSVREGVIDGGDLSLVTTGEKYIWNNKQDAIADLSTIINNASTGATHASSTHARTDATKVEASTTNGKIKIDGTETTVYTHPDSHAATMITEDDTHKFMTSTEKTKLSGIAENANNYVHPATHSADEITETDNRKFVTAEEKAQ